MMLDSPHTSAPMLMRGNALVLKTPVENAPRTSIEKHLSWSSDIPPAARFPLHRRMITSSRISAQPTTRHSLRGERGWRGTMTSRTTTRAANEQSPPKSACDGDAVLRTRQRTASHGAHFYKTGHRRSHRPHPMCKVDEHQC